MRPSLCSASEDLTFLLTRTLSSENCSESCSEIHADYVTLLFEKKMRKECKEHTHCLYTGTNDYQKNCIGCSLMLFSV